MSFASSQSRAAFSKRWFLSSNQRSRSFGWSSSTSLKRLNAPRPLSATSSLPMRVRTRTVFDVLGASRRYGRAGRLADTGKLPEARQLLEGVRDALRGCARVMLFSGGVIEIHLSAASRSTRSLRRGSRSSSQGEKYPEDPFGVTVEGCDPGRRSAVGGVASAGVGTPPILARRRRSMHAAKPVARRDASDRRANVERRRLRSSGRRSRRDKPDAGPRREPCDRARGRRRRATRGARSARDSRTCSSWRWRLRGLLALP